MPDNVFGAIVTGNDVVKAVNATVKLWAPDYIAEVSERSGRTRDALPMFRSFVKAYDLDRFDEDQVPAFVCVAPGTIGDPVKRSGQVQARWSVGCAALVSGKDADNTYELATLYTAALRVLLLQKSSLGQFAQGINWINERYNSLPIRATRTIAAGIIQIGVDVNMVAQPGMGPTSPSVNIAVPLGSWPEVEEVFVDIEQEPIGNA